MLQPGLGFQASNNSVVPKSTGLCVLVLCVSLPGVVSAQQAASSPASPDAAQPEHYVRMKLDNGAPLKVGATLRAHTLEPLFIGDRLVIPANAIVDGEIVRVVPAPRSRQIEAYCHGDFTPLREATLHFDKVVNSEGMLVPLATRDAELATTTVRLQSRTAKNRSLVQSLWFNASERAKGVVRDFTAPGRGTRAREFLYSQLPYHPQSLLMGTEFDVPILQTPDPPAAAKNAVKPSAYAIPSGPVTLYSRLATPLNSSIAKKGDAVTATVTRPLMSADGSVLVPQGTKIHGSVVQAKAARRLGRAGALRFTFSEVEMPTGGRQHVNGVPKAILAQPGNGHTLDSEGGVEPLSRRAVLPPLILTALATRSITSDEQPRANAAVSSNGFGLITRVVTASIGSNVLGGVIGGVTAARSIYSRFIGRGSEVKFPAHTPVEIELREVKSPVLSDPTPPKENPKEKVKAAPAEQPFCPHRAC